MRLEVSILDPRALARNLRARRRAPGRCTLALSLLLPGCSLLVDTDSYSVSPDALPGPTQEADPLLEADGNPGASSATPSASGDPTPAVPGAAPAGTGNDDCAARPSSPGCTEQLSPEPASGGTAPPAAAPAAAAPAAAATCAEQRSSFDDLYRRIRQDLAAVAAGDAIFYRYVSLTNRLTAEQCTEQLESGRQALTKMVNMLSLRPTLVAPVAIDTGTVYRIDLRDYGWNAAVTVEGRSFVDRWEAIVANNPYAVPFTGADASAARAASGTDVPLMFADQMLDVATVGNLYYALIDVDVTQTLSDFVLNELGIDIVQNILDQETIRAGTTQSRVSTEQRIVERHALGIRQGVLWQSFDVPAAGAGSGIFDNPFGFPTSETEAIFTLPNGLLAFIIADANGTIVEGSDILLDTNLNDFQAVTAVSCSNCHTAGFIPVTDEVRDVALAANLNADEAQQIRSIYVTPEEFERQAQQDSQSFYQRALGALGLPVTGADPVSTVYLRFDEDVTLATAAGDLGVSASTLQSNLPQLDPTLAVLDRGTLDRDDFTPVFVASLCALSSELQNRPDPAACRAAAR